MIFKNNNVPPIITVSPGADRLIPGGFLRKPKREHCFTISVQGKAVGKTEWSTIREICKAMQPFESDRTVPPPELLSSSGKKTKATTNNDDTERAVSMAKHIQSVMVLTDAIGKPNFCEALRLTDETKDRFAKASGEILAQRQMDCDLEQKNTLDKERSFSVPTKWGYHQQSRDIRVDVTHGVEESPKKENNSLGQQQQQQSSWFIMIPPYSLKGDKQLVHWQHLITNLAGKPVLGMKEGPSYDTLAFTSSTIGLDIYLFHNNNNAKEKVCHVSHNHTDGHVVQWSGSMKHHPPVVCVGHCLNVPAYRLANPNTGNVYAAVDKTPRSNQQSPMASSSSLVSSFSKRRPDNHKHFRVRVAPGCHALLFLGIALAIAGNDRARRQQSSEEDMNKMAIAF